TTLLNPATAVAAALGRVDLMKEYCRRYEEISPRTCQAGVLIAQGRYADALAEARRELEIAPSQRNRAQLARTLAPGGDSAAARRELAALEALARTRYVEGYSMAAGYAALGERARALVWLERDIQNDGANAPSIKVDPRLAPLRGDPKFEALVARAGLR